MKITTKYQTSPNSGASQILAKGFGRQKTIGYDPAKSSDWNHGNAAGAFLLAKSNDDPLWLAGEDWAHDSNDSGTVHTFTI